MTPASGNAAVLPFTFYPKRRFINIIVKNSGRAIARNCEARLKLLDKMHGCEAFNKQERSLMSEDNLGHKVDIGAKYGKTTFTLAFSQETFTLDQINLIGKIACSKTKGLYQIKHWIGTRRAIMTPEKYDQDGLCQGKFNVHMDVITETGQSVSSHFNIVVGEQWRDLDATIEYCNCNVN